MSTDLPARPPAHAVRAAWAVFVVFVVAGIGMATWASRIPAVRDGLGFSEAEMGVLLLTGAIGSLVALPLSGMIASRIGAGRTCVSFAALAAAGFAVATLAVDGDHPLLVRTGLFLGGMGVGIWDAAMNLEGAVVEQRLGRSVMPRFHAGFSLGTVAGAGIGALAAHAGASLAGHVITVMVIDLLVVVVCVRFFEPTPHTAAAGDGAAAPDTRADPATAVDTGTGHTLRDTLATWRESRTLLVGLVVLAAALTEGAANDWVSLAVVDGFGTPDSTGAIALAVFLCAMTLTRLAGTSLIDRYGRVTMLRACGAAALVGVLVFALVPTLWVALVGVAIWGAGASLGFPLGMSAASDDPKRAALRVSVVSTVGYSAFFVGPALIGFLAEHVGYRDALLVLAVPVAVGLVVAGAARPLPTASGPARTLGE
ncbi:MFS transporter [Krasilnikoviella flava]|uniref:Predicted arabinose efflux permease, MFS family n=1 Tax=Krasilnikoviella flava TaxID=526729 RepID=A0A1T5J9P6_9MICO|nr:MFS transporter [Krasilnikoviella flava]SKC47963.1 Predicted arabinose efflux permease, MFS family [Krasilnikoviella flava]